MPTDTSHNVLPCGDDASLEVWIDTAADLAVVRIRGNLHTVLRHRPRLQLPRLRIIDIRLSDGSRASGEDIRDYATSSALRAVPDAQSVIIATAGLQWGLARQTQAVIESFSQRQVHIADSLERAATALGLEASQVPSIFR